MVCSPSLAMLVSRGGRHAVVRAALARAGPWPRLPRTLPVPVAWQLASRPSGQHRALLVDAAKTLFGKPPPLDPMPVVLLSGFLGAGKTTVLAQLLKEKHGFKLGVVVNDLASVNVDANVLRKTIQDAGVQSISLENGCVCCTAAEDLRDSVNRLVTDAGPHGLDAIVVELSGVAEPSRTRQIIETKGYQLWWRRHRPISVRTIAVVDSQAFASDFLKEQSSHEEHAHTESGECDERYGALLAEQVECADMILLNKADVATSDELQQTRAVVKALNEIADTRTTEYGKVKVNELLGAEPKVFAIEEEQAAKASAAPPAQEKPKSACCVAKTCSKTNADSVVDCSEEAGAEDEKSRAETRFGITSFVYTTDRVMSRAKLLPHLGRWQYARESLGDKLSLEGLSDGIAPRGAASAGAEGSPLSPLLRSKGILLLDENPNVAYYWSHAGKSIQFSIYGPWPPNVPQEQGGFGAPRTELVFIGAGHDEGAIRNLLDSCLLTESEMAQGHGEQRASA